MKRLSRSLRNTSKKGSERMPSLYARNKENKLRADLFIQQLDDEDVVIVQSEKWEKTINQLSNLVGAYRTASPNWKLFLSGKIVDRVYQLKVKGLIKSGEGVFRILREKEEQIRQLEEDNKNLSEELLSTEEKTKQLKSRNKKLTTKLSKYNKKILKIVEEVPYLKRVLGDLLEK